VAAPGQAEELSVDTRRTSTIITATAALLLLAGTLVFVLQTDSWYLAFKAVHVVAAVLWVGGGTLLTLMAIVAERTDEPRRLLEVARQAEWAATRLFVPASFILLGMGIAMTINGDLDWGQFWLVFGLVAWAISTAIGIGFLTPRINALNRLLEEAGPDDPSIPAAIQPILLAARLDIALLLLIVVDMTVKPF
jgi:uncharacterized membrane protein